MDSSAGPIKGEIYTGEEFTKLMEGKRLVKLTNASEKHHDHQYTDGLNVIKGEFKTVDPCSPGGFYFIEYSEALEWLDYDSSIGDMVHIRDVKLLPDSKVYVESGKFKTDKFILGVAIPLAEVFDCYKLLLSYSKRTRCAKRCLNYMHSPIPDHILAAIAMQNYQLFVDICKEHYPLVKDALLTEDKDFSIMFHSPEWAIMKFPHNIAYVPQTPELCKLAVSLNWRVLDLVENQTIEVCKIALNASPEALTLIEGSEDMLRRLVLYSAAKHDHALLHVETSLFNGTLCQMAVWCNWRSLGWMPRNLRKYEVCLIAAARNIDALQYVPFKLKERIIDELAAKYGAEV